jgi:hypothetical protein
MAAALMLTCWGLVLKTCGSMVFQRVCTHVHIGTCLYGSGIETSITLNRYALLD